jgi:transcriptional regulator with XRE-family HTH domain
MKRFNGRKLKASRLAKGWGIPELVYQIRRLTGISISEAAVRDHEQGRALNPRAQTIAAYAATLGVGIGTFFTGAKR